MSPRPRLFIAAIFAVATITSLRVAPQHEATPKTKRAPVATRSEPAASIPAEALGSCGGKAKERPWNCEHRFEHPQCLSAGQIQIKFARGADPAKVVDAHSQSKADLIRSVDPPFDSTERFVGLDRDYKLRVPIGKEIQKVREYGADPRVEFVDLAAAGGTSLGDLWGIGNGKPCGGF